VKSLHLKDNAIEIHNWKLHDKYERIRKDEARAESYMLDGATIAIVAFGTAARVGKTAIQWAARKGSPRDAASITLFPFPGREVFELAKTVDVLLVIEMNTGQMVEDVRQSTRFTTGSRFSESRARCRPRGDPRAHPAAGGRKG